MANHVIRRVENRLVVSPNISTPLTGLFARLDATDTEVAAVRVIAETAVTPAELAATVIEVASSSDAGVMAEAAARAAADTAEAAARVAGIAAEATLRAAADNTLTTGLTAVNTELVASRQGFGSLATLTAYLKGDIDGLRAGYASSDARIDITETNVIALQTEVGQARGGESDLLTRLNLADATVETEVRARSLATNDKLTTGRVVAQRPRRSVDGFWYDAASFAFKAWAVGVVPSRTIERLNAITFALRDLSGIGSFKVEVITRPVATGDIGGPGSVGDTAAGFYVVNAVDVVDESRLTVPQPVRIPIGLGPFTSSTILFFKLTAYSGTNGTGSVVSYGIAQGQPGDASPTYLRGYIFTTSLNVADSYALSGTESIAFWLEEGVATDQADLDGRNIQRIDPVSPLVSHWPALEANIPEMVLRRAAGDVNVKGQLVNFAQPGTQEVTLTSFDLAYNEERNLEHQFISGALTVTRLSDSVVLTEGTDYAVNRTRASIRGLINTATFAVSIAYTGSLSRYDLLHVDPLTGVVAVTAGTARGTDASEYKPACPAGKLPLFSVFVTRDNGIDVVPVHLFSDFVRQGREGEDAAWLTWCRNRLPNTFRKLTAGATVRLAGYGDSITEQGGGGAAGTPNGTNRDTRDYYWSGRLPADTIAAMTLFDFNDGGGSIHVKLGWNWFIKAAMEARYGAHVRYDNWGVGGSTSSSGTDNGVAGGLNTARLTPLIASAPDLVVISFGMNDVAAGAATYTNIRSLVSQLKTAGIECLVMGLPLIPPAGMAFPLDRWGDTNDAIIQAAIDEDVAYVPVAQLFDPENLGAVGLSRRSVGMANGVNHPGPAELAAIGRYTARIFGGRGTEVAPAILTGNKRQATSQAITSTAFEATSLVTHLEASRTYAFEIVHHLSCDATSGIKFDLHSPGTMTVASGGLIYGAIGRNDDTSTEVFGYGRADALNTTFTMTGLTSGRITIEGTISTVAAGPLSVRAGLVTGSAAAAVLRGGTLKIIEIA